MSDDYEGYIPPSFYSLDLDDPKIRKALKKKLSPWEQLQRRFPKEIDFCREVNFILGNPDHPLYQDCMDAQRVTESFKPPIDEENATTSEQLKALDMEIVEIKSDPMYRDRETNSCRPEKPKDFRIGGTFDLWGDSEDMLQCPYYPDDCSLVSSDYQSVSRMENIKTSEHVQSNKKGSFLRVVAKNFGVVCRITFPLLVVWVLVLILNSCVVIRFKLSMPYLLYSFILACVNSFFILYLLSLRKGKKNKLL